MGWETTQGHAMTETTAGGKGVEKWLASGGPPRTSPGFAVAGVGRGTLGSGVAGP